MVVRSSHFMYMHAGHERHKETNRNEQGLYHREITTTCFFYEAWLVRLKMAEHMTKEKSDIINIFATLTLSSLG